MFKTTWETLPQKTMELILPELGNTFYMVALATLFSLLFGTIMAVLLISTENQELAPNRTVNLVLDTIVNIVMAFPFIILAIYIIPFTRLIAGTSIGPKAAVVPLTIVGTAFVAKLYRDGLREVNPWVIHGAKSFGASNWQIIRIMLKESLPALFSGFIMTVINLLAYTTMAGALGAGGVGSVAILYGYQHQDTLLIVAVAFVLLVLVEIFQFTGDGLYKKLK